MPETEPPERACPGCGDIVPADELLLIDGDWYHEACHTKEVMNEYHENKLEAMPRSTVILAVAPDHAGSDPLQTPLLRILDEAETTAFEDARDGTPVAAFMWLEMDLQYTLADHDEWDPEPGLYKVRLRWDLQEGGWAGQTWMDPDCRVHIEAHERLAPLPGDE